MHSDEEDWLLPVPPVDPLPSSEFAAADDDPLVAGAASLMEWEDFVTPRPPIFTDTGEPAPPPISHVRDHLARAFDLVDEQTQLEHPIAATTVVVLESLPTCDMCESTARYDARVLTPDGFSGAYLCVDHVRGQATHLGGDGAVYLMHLTEVPPELQEQVDARLRTLGQAQLFNR